MAVKTIVFTAILLSDKNEPQKLSLLRLGEVITDIISVISLISGQLYLSGNNSYLVNSLYLFNLLFK